MRNVAVLVHYCDTCHYNTPVASEVSDRQGNHICAHCGLSSSSATGLLGRVPAEMEYSQHDELARLFAQNMQLSPDARHQIEQLQQQAAPVEHIMQMPEKQLDPTIHYVSAHYTGTAYVRADAQSAPSYSPPPSYHDAVMSEAMATDLRRHGIDPYTLLANQIQLFQGADDEQKMRLLALWRTAPPSYALDEQIGGAFDSTSVEREEALAKLRYEYNAGLRPANSIYLPSTEEHMLDTHFSSDANASPMSPIREAGEPAFPPAARMRAASIASSRPPTHHADAEPYMTDNYTADRVSRSFDPVYNTGSGFWQDPAAQRYGAIEEQYGMYEQIRNHADWERMNERIANERLGALHSSSMDAEMIL